MFYVSYVSHAFASVHCCLVVTCWERTCLLALVGNVYYISVSFTCGILGQVWNLIVSFPDSFRLSYFLHKLEAAGVTGEVLKWFKSYLSDRRQQVVLPGYLLFGTISERVLLRDLSWGL